jgi:flagellar assembly factor FliW
MGNVEVGPEDIVRFIQPIFGFEHLHDYVFLYEKITATLYGCNRSKTPASVLF